MELFWIGAGFIVGGICGFFAACLCKMAADEPNGIPRNVVSMPPRSRSEHTSGMN